MNCNRPKKKQRFIFFCWLSIIINYATYSNKKVEFQSFVLIWRTYTLMDKSWKQLKNMTFVNVLFFI